MCLVLGARSVPDPVPTLPNSEPLSPDFWVLSVSPPWPAGHIPPPTTDTHTWMFTEDAISTPGPKALACLLWSAGRGSCSSPSLGLPLAHTYHHWLTAWVLPTSSQRLPPPQGHSLFPGGWEQGVSWGGRLSALRLGCWRYINLEASFYGILGEGEGEGGAREGAGLDAGSTSSP